MKRKKRVLLTISICLLSAVILLLVAFLLFQTRKIEVTGNQYCEEQQLVEWIQSDKMAFNSLYIWLKYN
ncbi:MAG: cell division protein FtsQ, partial [Candidatus Ruminococcus intestinipullorum]|nr:cell division protein FtsQ [Candidatus Ruminococcus intestinipullorum]